MVELHRGVIERHFTFPLDPKCLWGHLQPVSLGGAAVLTLWPEDLLFILCIHGSKHLWERLSQICDVAELIRGGREMDWEQITEQAAVLGGVRIFFLGLYLASDFLVAARPEEVLQKAKADFVVKILAREVHERLFCEDKGPLEVFEESPFAPPTSRGGSVRGAKSGILCAQRRPPL